MELQEAAAQAAEHVGLITLNLNLVLHSTAVVAVAPVIIQQAAETVTKALLL
jgi:hypothetical protein